MKKILCVLLVIVLLGALSASLFACKSTPRDEILKLYFPGEYIDEDIFPIFESWYKEQTGKNVKVVLDEFDAVENIQLAVEGSKADYDILCPSDYMVEYLIKKQLVLPFDQEIVGAVSSATFKSDYVELMKLYDPNLQYAIPYMYGTLGIVYDKSKTNKEITSWDALFGREFSGHISVKDSIRDAYAAACLYNARTTLSGLSGAEQKAAVQAVFEDTTAETVNKAKNTLLGVKRVEGNVWDVDDIKYEMGANKSNVAVALMWSCDAGYVMNDYEDLDGKMHAGNRNLWYVVPEEGGNVYIDNLVINKYAKNAEAANYFLKFLCRADIAKTNSEWAGAVSIVAAVFDELYEEYTADEDGMFEGAPTGWKEMFLETMFPSSATLNRCGVMKDLGDGKTRVSTMWSQIQ
ncbi:MAG: extracellular solute-binding protein [Clostridia bacterium]|nr:extracellular solute-binding protein [Clostridia bacterium]